MTATPAAPWFSHNTGSPELSQPIDIEIKLKSRAKVSEIDMQGTNEGGQVEVVPRTSTTRQAARFSPKAPSSRGAPPSRSTIPKRSTPSSSG